MIIYRHLQTPDGTILISRHRHDFLSYKDKNDKVYLLDGGVSSGYYRSSVNGDEKFFEVTSDDKFEVIREYFERWNRHSHEYVKLKNISDTWLQNIIDWFIDNNYQNHYTFRLFVEEKLYRAENEISVSDQLELYIEYDY